MMFLLASHPRDARPTAGRWFYDALPPRLPDGRLLPGLHLPVTLDANLQYPLSSGTRVSSPVDAPQSEGSSPSTAAPPHFALTKRYPTLCVTFPSCPITDNARTHRRQRLALRFV